MILDEMRNHKNGIFTVIENEKYSVVLSISSMIGLPPIISITLNDTSFEINRILSKIVISKDLKEIYWANKYTGQHLEHIEHGLCRTDKDNYCKITNNGSIVRLIMPPDALFDRNDSRFEPGGIV